MMRITLNTHLLDLESVGSWLTIFDHEYCVDDNSSG